MSHAPAAVKRIRQACLAWLGIYGGPEIAGLLAAALAFGLVRAGGPLRGSAFLGSWAEDIAFVGYFAVRAVRKESRHHRQCHWVKYYLFTFGLAFWGLIVELGPAEAVGKFTVSSASGLRCGLVDRAIEGGPADYRGQVADLAEQLAWSPHYTARLAAKAQALTAAEKEFPLAAYRHQELAVMSRNFFDPKEPYAQLRRAFVYKDRPTQTPPHLSDRRILLGSNTRSL